MASETISSENYEKTDDLTKIHDEELTTLKKLTLIIKVLKTIKNHDKNLNKRLEEKKTFLIIGDYMEFIDREDLFLNVKKYCSTEDLTYTESKFIKEELIKQLKEIYQPIIEFKNRMANELGADAFDNIKGTSRAKMFELNSQYCSNLEKIVQMRNRKCNLLNQVAQIKSSSLLTNELEFFLKELHHNQLKAKVLSGFMKNELPTRSERSMLAIKEIQNYIENALDVKK